MYLNLNNSFAKTRVANEVMQKDFSYFSFSFCLRSVQMQDCTKMPRSDDIAIVLEAYYVQQEAARILRSS